MLQIDREGNVTDTVAGAEIDPRRTTLDCSDSYNLFPLADRNTQNIFIFFKPGQVTATVLLKLVSGELVFSVPGVHEMRSDAKEDALSIIQMCHYSVSRGSVSQADILAVIPLVIPKVIP